MISLFRHRRLQKNLLLYADDELPQNERLRISQHLENCATCRQKLDDIRACRELLKAGQAKLFVPTEQLWQCIFRKTSALAPQRFGPGKIFSPAGQRWAIAVVVLLSLGGLVWKNNAGKQPFTTPVSATIDYGIFLEDLRHNADEAKFYQRYPAEVVQLAEAQQAIAFPLAEIAALPDSIRLDCVRVLECNGQKCVQYTCVKAGKMINIFQHAPGQAWTIGQYAAPRSPLCNVACPSVNTEDLIAMSWQGKNSEYVAIGELTPQELAQVVQVLR